MELKPDQLKDLVHKLRQSIRNIKALKANEKDFKGIESEIFQLNPPAYDIAISYMYDIAISCIEEALDELEHDVEKVFKQ